MKKLISSYRNRVQRFSRRLLIVAIALFICWWWFFALPADLFDAPYSSVIYDKNDQLLGATVAADGQWRFPAVEVVPHKFATSVLSFEDERFYAHPGVDVISVCRALVQNIRAGRVVSGASTISMQVIRLHRRNKGRTLTEKIIESLLALRLECRYSKDEIIALWSAHAPFGGNVIGLEAASWRYYGRSPASLSWAEASTLAVLPNAPSIIHPGRNRNLLMEKRDRLLYKLLAEQKLDSMTAELAVLEPLPKAPLPMPSYAPHLLAASKGRSNEKRSVKSTLDRHLQVLVNETLAQHHKRLAQNQIHNAAALVVDVAHNAIIAYVGNVNAGKEHGQDVDIVRAPRSSGSIIKPFLYATMNQDGELLPKELVTDIPTQLNGFRPENFYNRYDGVVPADEALSRSLNIPAVRMLKDYGVERFHQVLQELSFSTIRQSPDHYGLSLILGGAEVTLWDLARSYSSMARVLGRYHENFGSYSATDWDDMKYTISDKDVEPDPLTEYHPVLDAGASFLALQALTNVRRPSQESGWEQFQTSRQIGWKTGTSIGFRDAWAVGVTPEYVVAVWVGNADGEGRPDLVGVKAAAPVMFDIFNSLPPTTWFEVPYDELREIEICSRSGLKKGRYCPQAKKQYIHKNGLRRTTCHYHHRIFTDRENTYRVNRNCREEENVMAQTKFTLPPAVAYYYKKYHSDYSEDLPVHPDCQQVESKGSMEVVYPQQGSTISLPRNMSGEPGSAVFEVAHVSSDAVVYWHVDGDYLGRTTGHHSLHISPTTGPHVLKVVDENGIEIKHRFEVVQ